MKYLLIVSICALLLSCTKQPAKNVEALRADSLKRADSLGKAELQAAEERLLVALDSAKKAAGSWRINNFADKFGDPTKDKYMKIGVDGTFSNSATSGAYLFAEILITKKSVGIFLHEYKIDRPAVKPIGSYTINLKNSEGKTTSMHSSSSWNDDGGISLNNYDWSPDVTTFRRFIQKSNGEVKVVITGEYQGVYRFSFQVDDFNDKYQTL